MGCSVIAAHAAAIRDIVPRFIVVGNPAKLLNDYNSKKYDSKNHCILFTPVSSYSSQ